MIIRISYYKKINCIRGEKIMKIWAKIIKDNKIIRDEVVISDIEGSYQENLKICITELCNKLDISKPYWLPINMEEYNKRGKTTFNEHNFIDQLNFDKLIIEELDTPEV
jgi:hypothetical protein